MLFGKIIRSFSLILLMAAAYSVSAQQGGAQEGGAPPEGGAQQQAPDPSEAPGASSEPVSEEDVEQFAGAYGAVQEIQEDYTERLQDVEDRDEAQSLQQEAQTKMVTAVEDSGMSVEDYNEMIARMDQDPELREQVFEIVGQS